jgi:hypothetical protein
MLKEQGRLIRNSNMLYCAFCRENLETLAEVRLYTYEDVADKLRELEVEKNDGSLTPGGIFKRVIFSVPAKGPSSARQEITRGESCVGVQKDRQFTDQNCNLEDGAAAVLMRHRACHFCDCCLRLDPMDRANRKVQYHYFVLKRCHELTNQMFCALLSTLRKLLLLMTLWGQTPAHTRHYVGPPII